MTYEQTILSTKFGIKGINTPQDQHLGEGAATGRCVRGWVGGGWVWVGGGYFIIGMAVGWVKDLCMFV